MWLGSHFVMLQFSSSCVLRCAVDSLLLPSLCNKAHIYDPETVNSLPGGVGCSPVSLYAQQTLRHTLRLSQKPNNPMDSLPNSQSFFFRSLLTFYFRGGSTPCPPRERHQC